MLTAGGCLHAEAFTTAGNFGRVNSPSCSQAVPWAIRDSLRTIEGQMLKTFVIDWYVLPYFGNNALYSVRTAKPAGHFTYNVLLVTKLVNTYSLNDR